MKPGRVLRFAATAFAVGAFIGLVSGLAFGGTASQSDNLSAKTSVSKSPATEVVSSASTGEDASLEGPMTAERAKAIGANEMGLIPVLMYHLIEPEETEWARTPENFRSDIALLEKEGFWPINVRDLASGNIDIPAGKSPVVITFDDSSMGQYHILEDGSLDPDCAVGIIQAEVEAGRWASRASFFPLIDVDVSSREIFGQPELKREKLRSLVAWGYEVGSHTVTHLNLAKASRQEAVKQLAQSQQILEDLIGGGYSVTSLALPFGEYPASDDLIASGQYQDITYRYTAAVSTAGELCPSPFSNRFRALHIPRIRGSTKYLTAALDTLKKNPELRYVSDGDPTTVSAPLDLDPTLGEMLDDLGRPVVRY